MFDRNHYQLIIGIRKGVERAINQICPLARRYVFLNIINDEFGCKNCKGEVFFNDCVDVKVFILFQIASVFLQDGLLQKFVSDAFN